MHLILLLALAGGTAFAGSQYLNAAGAQTPDLTPRIAGVNADHLLMGLGVVGALVGGPVIAALGVGALVAGAVNKVTTARTRTGLENLTALSAQAAMLPGPAPGPALIPPGGPVANAADKLRTGIQSLFRPRAQPAA